MFSFPPSLLHFLLSRCSCRSEREPAVCCHTAAWSREAPQQGRLQTGVSGAGAGDRLGDSQQERKAAGLLQEDGGLPGLHPRDPQEQEGAADAPYPQHDQEVLQATVGRGRQEVEDGGSRCRPRHPPETAGQ